MTYKEVVKNHTNAKCKWSFVKHGRESNENREYLLQIGLEEVYCCAKSSLNQTI